MMKESYIYIYANLLVVTVVYFFVDEEESAGKNKFILLSMKK